MFPTLIKLSARPATRSVRPTLVQRGYASSWVPPCPTWIDKNTPVITQGFTGKQVCSNPQLLPRFHGLSNFGNHPHDLY